MPVTFEVANHGAESIQFDPKTSPQAFAMDIRRKVDVRLQRYNEARCNLLASSLNTPLLPQSIPTKNGFVDACVSAFNRHHHLVIRPDDVWMAIISQFSFYVNGHEDELTAKVVPIEKRKKLSIEVEGDSWMSDSGWITKSFVKSLNRNLTDKTLDKFILPKFSTTTKADALCTAIVMMGRLRSYFSYEEMTLCGIPSVTLAGRKSDYVEILTRLDRFKEFGEEMYLWGEMLRPIIRRFISAFDGKPDRAFWNMICHKTPEMCGEEHYTGWITAFCPFDEKGHWQLYVPIVPEHIGHLYLDDIQYQALRADKVPWGFCGVEFDVIKSGTKMEAVFVAGLMGMKVSDTPPGTQSALGLEPNQSNCCIAPHPAWFIYEKEQHISSPKQPASDLQDLHHFLRRLEYTHSPLSTGIPVVTLPPLGGPPPIVRGVDRLHKGDYYHFLSAHHNPPVNHPLSLLTRSTKSDSGKSDGSRSGSSGSPTSAHRQTPSNSSTETPTLEKEKDMPRRLRKGRTPGGGDAGGWVFPGTRRPLSPTTNNHN